MTKNQLPTKKDIYEDYINEIEGLENAISSKLYSWKKEEREIYYLEQRILELEETAKLYKPDGVNEKELYQPKYRLDNQFNAVSLADDVLNKPIQIHVELNKKETENLLKSAKFMEDLYKHKEIINRKLTELDSADAETLFDRASESAEKFGQSISKVLENYIEFANKPNVNKEIIESLEKASEMKTKHIENLEEENERLRLENEKLKNHALSKQLQEFEVVGTTEVLFREGEPLTDSHKKHILSIAQSMDNKMKTYKTIEVGISKATELAIVSENPMVKTLLKYIERIENK